MFILIVQKVMKNKILALVDRVSYQSLAEVNIMGRIGGWGQSDRV